MIPALTTEMQPQAEMEIDSQAITEVQPDRYSWGDVWYLKRNIVRYGQHMRLSAQWLGKLLAAVAEPMDDFIHLVRNPEACIASLGPYHVSVAQWPVATWDDFNYLSAILDGQEVTLPFTQVLNYGFMQLGDCELATLVRPIHSRADAWYNDRPLHISGGF